MQTCFKYLFIFTSVILFHACSSHKKLPPSAVEEKNEEAPRPQILFLWPVKNPRVMNFYGWRGRKRMHDGIDIAAKLNDPIYSSESGRVVHAGWIRGYGRTVILSHGGEWYTLYAHLSKITAKAGIWIGRGMQVGLAGRSGHATGVHLHFEIRKYADPLDPLLFLPK
jgi:murein DD-endopeptidase MepM/ murein hydrolase activator NlpD